MKKTISLITIGILIISGLGAIAINENENNNVVIEKILFSKPIIQEKNNYIKIVLPESTSDSWETDKPLMPVITKVYTFPFGTKINNVDVIFSDTKEIKITKPIKLSPEPQMLSQFNKAEQKTIVSYSKIDIYPENKYSYKVGAGLKDGKHVIYVFVSLQPVQYKPNENTIYYSDLAEIKISYTKPKTPFKFGDEYDLLIITPTEFASTLKPLAEHKNQSGYRTIIVTLDEIPFVGNDLQESIKYYIKDAIEKWGITYLILVGGGVKGFEKFPVRYAYVPSNPYEDSFPSDLYYADIYNATSNFSTWDYDGDGKYAEYPQDIQSIDVLPDVYLGKIPCNNLRELKVVVNKIINYKQHNRMTNKIMQVGGDTFVGDSEGIYEGEFTNNVTLANLPGYKSIKIWASKGNLKKGSIARGFKSCIDFADFSGHGSWASWATHPSNDENVWIPQKVFFSPYSGWLYIDFDLFFVFNAKKLPVVFYNACSNNKFTESEKCLSWYTINRPRGGGIAAFGASGIGYGSQGASEPDRLMGWMEVNTFKEILNNKILGLAWSNCIVNYYANFSSSLKDTDYKTMLEYSMFGDPTLAIQDGDNPINIPNNRPFLFELFNKPIN
ncbi:MAG: C25 family cysteine peptidase [Thermoplasmatota archaeon]